MQPFSICCTTCKARLKVRDEAALGQILACPKCGSMVLVTPPSAAEPSDAAPLLSGLAAAAVLPDADLPLASPNFDDVAALISDDHPPASSGGSSASTPASATPPVVEPAVPRAAAQAPAVVPPAPVALAAPALPPSEPVAALAPAMPVAVPEAPAPLPPIASAPPLPTTAPDPIAALDHSAPVTAASALQNVASSLSTLGAALWANPSLRQAALVGGAVSAGIVLAVTVVGLLIARGRSVPPEEPAAVVALESNTPHEPAPATDPTPAAATPAAAPQATPLMEIPAPPPAAAPPAIANKPNASDLEVDAEPPTKVDAAAEKSPAAAVAEEPAGTKANPVEHVARLEQARKAGPDDLAPAEKHPAKPATAGDGLGQFGKFLLDNSVPDAPAKPVLPPVLDEVSQSRAPPPKVDVAARLADPIAAIDLPGLGLADFAQLVSDMSTIPISIDPSALQQLGLSSETPVAVKQSSTSVGQVLAQSLKPLGLTTVTEAGHVRIVRPAPVGGLLRRVRYDVSDLVADDPSVLPWLSQLLPQFIAPATWSAGGGAGKLQVEGSALVVEQGDAVHFQNLLLIEKLRLARGKAQRSRVSPALLKLEPAAERAAAKLARPLTLNYIRPTRLTQVLSRVHEVTGMRVLVDWPAVYEANWGVNAETRVAVSGESTAQALDKLLQPMDLAWRVVDENTIQVSTDRALAAQPEIAFYNVRAALAASRFTPEKLLERLQGKFNGGQFAYDPVSQHVLAMVAAPQHEALRNSLSELAGK